MTPDQVIDQYIEAYNKHDIDATMKCFSSDAAIYALTAAAPEEKTPTQIRDMHAGWFKSKSIGIPVHRATFHGVVAQQYILIEEGTRYIGGALVIFQVQDGLITRCDWVAPDDQPFTSGWSGSRKAT